MSADLDSRPAGASGLVTRMSTMPKRTKALAVGGGLFLILAFVRSITHTPSLTSSGTMRLTLQLTIPIMLAGLAGLWAERSGVVNIGIEGMMIFGTWFGGYAAWHWGAWAGLAFGIVGGIIGGLIHALATVKFNVDHIISGVAINILALGAMRYMSDLAFVGHQGGGVSQSPQQRSSIPTVSVPFLAGGKIGGWKSPDVLGWLERKQIFAISDIGGILRGLVFQVSLAIVIAALLVPLTAWVLWRTRFGLRVRSSGESPESAETLGVKVVPLRYMALAISGGFAGFGGAYLSVVLSSYYRQGQTANRGFIGLATMIFGNWRPSGVVGGATLFGFGSALNLVASKALPKLFYALAIAAGLSALYNLYRRKVLASVVAVVSTALFTVAYHKVHKVPEPLTNAVPYVMTLIVLGAATQRLRPPAHAGRPYRPGESH
jgi:simple sugar transport system permease protein